MSLRRLAITAALCAFAAGCGREAPDFWIHGAGVRVESDAPFARAPDLPVRLETTLAAALGYWGGDWDRLAGARIVLTEDRFACGGSAQASGCWDGNTLRVSTWELGAPLPCLENTALVHEVGHAVIGDPGHEDPRWMDFGEVASELAGRSGYARPSGPGEAALPVSCEIAVSAWRQLPR